MRYSHRSGYAVAISLALISLGGLSLPDIYAREMPNWEIQAIAQDWFDLVVAAPALAIAAWFAGRGSRIARLALCGGLLFATYTLAIYAFAVHLNALFLLYCAGLGCAVFGLVAVAAGLVRDGAGAWFPESTPRRAAAATLIGLGVVFGVLWLAQLVPAAITGEPPAELRDTGLLTNPVHVLDLSMILPLHVLAGVLLIRRRPLGAPLAAVMLAFGALMATSIAVLMWMSAAGPIAIAMAAVGALEAVLFVRLDHGRITAGSRSS
jgi:hypothetical protein